MKAQVYRYEINLTAPQTRFVHVKLSINAKKGKNAFHLPVWTPGSYLVRDFPKHVINVKAKDSEENNLEISKTSKHTWIVNTDVEKEIIIEYDVYCHDLSVRTSYISHDFALLNLTTVLMFYENDFNSPVEISVITPKKWEIKTSLKKKGNLYYAENIDEAYDSPILAGNLIKKEFKVLDTPHELIIASGVGNYDLQILISALKKIIPENASVFENKELPYDSYKFLLILSEKTGGGLEHKNSNVSMFPRLKFVPEKDLYRFYSLEAHEHFHSWLVKRIKPQAFMPYDYLNETYTRLLWVFEGITSYYDDLVPVRAKVVPIDHYLKTIEDNINNYENTPGKDICSLEEASFNAWIGLYKPDENTPNVYVSYYLKGGLVTMLLDMYLRKHGSSMDQVMNYLWENYGKKGIGIKENEMEQIITQATKINVKEFFEKYIKGTAPLPYDLLQTVGLELKKEQKKDDPPYIGIKSDKNIVKTVYANSPAYEAGIAPGDIIITINGFALEQNDIDKTLNRFSKNENVTIRILREGIEHSVNVRLEQPRPKYKVIKTKNPSTEQIKNWEKWLKI